MFVHCANNIKVQQSVISFLTQIYQSYLSLSKHEDKRDEVYASFVEECFKRINEGSMEEDLEVAAHKKGQSVKNTMSML
jgi:hypothetical protein